MSEILDYLKEHPGEHLDSDLASAIGASLDDVRLAISALAKAGEVVVCRYTRFVDGEPIDGCLCRQATYRPKAENRGKSGFRIRK